MHVALVVLLSVLTIAATCGGFVLFMEERLPIMRWAVEVGRSGPNGRRVLDVRRFFFKRRAQSWAKRRDLARGNESRLWKARERNRKIHRSAPWWSSQLW